LVIGTPVVDPKDEICSGARGRGGIDQSQFREPGFRRQHGAARAGLRACRFGAYVARKKAPP
jgi:hypothetical protein